MPLASACRRHASGIQCSRNLPQGRRTSLLRFADDREDIGSEPISLGGHGLQRALAGLLEPWVTKGHPACLCSRESLPGASLTAANDLDFGGRPFGQLAVLIGTARHAGGHAATGGRPEITAVTAFVPVPR
jgi:hypothetical protein